MARVFEKVEGFENFVAQIRKICEDNDLVPILMDRSDVRVTNKTTGKKEKRGLYDTGRKTKYFTCVKPECSWVEYHTDELIEQDSPVEYYGE